MNIFYVENKQKNLQWFLRFNIETGVIIIIIIIFIPQAGIEAEVLRKSF